MTFDPQRFHGVFTALVTPFDGDGVDYPAFARLTERQIAAGVAGLVPVGTTGEAATLSEEEAEQVIALTVRVTAGRALVMAGAGSNDTSKAVEKARRAEAAGADALLVVAPYYNRPTQRGLLAHFGAVADATGLPVMLYSVPGRCGVEIAAETCAELFARHGNIVGIKEAGGSVERVTRIRRLCGPDFIVHCGDDALTLPFLAAGAVGVTSVTSNFAPEAVVGLVNAWREGRWRDALAAHEALAGLNEALFVESNPGPVKAALALDGLAPAGMRAPMVEIAPSSLERLTAAIHDFRAQRGVFQETRQGERHA